jgi:hypothetical protein
MMRTSGLFIALSVLGVLEAIYHAWLEKAFVTNIFVVNYAPIATFFGVPYWVFGVVWFPLVLVVSLWSTRLGSSRLSQALREKGYRIYSPSFPRKLRELVLTLSKF